MNGAYDLVVLAGGGARRLGGVDKVMLPLDGVPTLERLLSACDDAGRLIVVGPQRATAHAVIWCREDPPGSGPLAGLAAALPHVTADTVVLAAGDMPFLGAAKDPLLAALRAQPAVDAAVLRDDAGVRQPLAGAYRRTSVAARLQALGEVRDLPVKLLMDGLRIVDVPAGSAARDVDTWDDVYRIEEELHRAR